MGLWLSQSLQLSHGSNCLGRGGGSPVVEHLSHRLYSRLMLLPAALPLAGVQHS
jgi:hypothetical protein